VAAGGIARRDADGIAESLFRKVVDKFLAENILRDQERCNLDALAQALDISPGRANRIEEEAKSDHYRRAVSAALADGAVTAEEAKTLNDLQARLGVAGSKWSPGDVVHRQ
jgi:uncharacterized membrane protein YebE (DUF533 family)